MNSLVRHHFRAIAVVAVVALIPLLISSSVRAAPPAASQPTIAQVRLAAQHSIEIQWKGYPSIARQSAGELFHFKFNHDALDCQTNITGDPHRSAGETYRIRFTDLPGEATIQTSYGADPTAKFVSFNYFDFSNPADVLRHTQFLQSPISLQIVQDIQTQVQTQSTTLIQSYGEGGGDVTLRVAIISDINGKVSRNDVMSAKTLAELRQKYPVETEAFLRPMFKSINQADTVFSVDTKAAWQLVADQFRAGPAVVEQVKLILRDFSDDSYRTREAAQKRLESLGEPAALYLMTFDAKSLSAEQRSRVSLFLKPYHPFTEPQWNQLRNDPAFLIDCLDNDDPALRIAIAQRLQKVVGHKIDFDPTKNLPPDERTHQLNQLRDSLLATTTKPTQ